MEQFQNLQVGEWVRGKTNVGELYHGYIHSDEPTSHIIKVRVVKSDNDLMEGKVISTNRSKISRIETSVSYTKEALLDLIDVSLLVKDRDWFLELTSLLKKAQEIGVLNSNISSINRKEIKKTDYIKGER